MIIFGNKDIREINDCDIENLFHLANTKALALKKTPIDKIIEVLDRVGQKWQVGSHYYKMALEQLPSELSFSKEMIEQTLNIIPELLSASQLKKRILLELGSTDCLDTFQYLERYGQYHKYESLGTLVHISAGNVFLGCIDSLLMGFLTKNVNILKLSSQNQIFPMLFASSLIDVDLENVLADKFAITYWQGGRTIIENQVKSRANAIICWGGEESISSWKSQLPISTSLFEYGPKISFQVLSHEGFAQSDPAKLCERFVRDVCMWDQAACASAQVMYVQKGIDLEKLMSALEKAFQQFSVPRGKLDANEEVEILKAYFRAQYHSDDTKIYPIKGSDFMMVFDIDSRLSVSPLNRTLVIKEYQDPNDLAGYISPYAYNLQSCALAVSLTEIESYSQILASSGVTRIVPAGKMLASAVGAPHDGRFGLAELVKVVSRENYESELQQFLDYIAGEIPFYQNHEGIPFEQWPLISGDTFVKYGPGSDQPKLFKPSLDGHYFASGGTTGAPKYSFFSNQEFERTCQLMADSYLQLGLKAGDVVANLFVAANMWSSFSAVQKALEKCHVRQLPIGGQCDANYINEYFKIFSPSVVFGIPSLITELSKQVSAQVDTFFYAGEMLTEGQMQILRDNWNVQKFYSAGYASVDVGPIGYQVPGGEHGEHYLFDGIYLEEINGEAIVTSTIRKSLPIIRYKTGDKVKIIERSPKFKFKLMGRQDQTIFIWSSRIPLIDIYQACQLSGIEKPLQVQIRFNQEKKDDELILLLKTTCTDKDHQVKSKLYSLCRDLAQTVDFTRVEKNIILENSHNPYLHTRTGKYSNLVDLR